MLASKNPMRKFGRKARVARVLPLLNAQAWYGADCGGYKSSLALKLNIQRRGMTLDTRCPVSNRLDEDGGRCFLKRKFVKYCWSDLQLEHVRQKLLDRHSAWEVVEEVLYLNEVDCLRTVILLWKWWSNRNQLDHGERGLTRDQFLVQF